jgi:hypothetical protein
MSVETPLVAQYNSHDFQPINVLRAPLRKEGDEVYYLSPDNPVLPQQVPTVAMTVEKLTYNESGDPTDNNHDFLVAGRPDMRIIFESGDAKVLPKHVAMLANAAFRSAPFMNITVHDERGLDPAYDALLRRLYGETLDMHQELVADVDGVSTASAYIGTTAQLPGATGAALRAANISTPRL